LFAAISMISAGSVRQLVFELLSLSTVVLLVALFLFKHIRLRLKRL
jgi:hypothetical protein